MEKIRRTKMKYIICAMLLGMMACDKGPPCPPYSDDDLKSGIFSKDLGTVQIDGESCRIIETYERDQCQKRGSWNQIPQLSCDGVKIQCYNKTLTRITKCPSGTI